MAHNHFHATHNDDLVNFVLYAHLRVLVKVKLNVSRLLALNLDCADNDDDDDTAKALFLKICPFAVTQMSFAFRCLLRESVFSM